MIKTKLLIFFLFEHAIKQWLLYLLFQVNIIVKIWSVYLRTLVSDVLLGSSLGCFHQVNLCINFFHYYEFVDLVWYFRLLIFLLRKSCKPLYHFYRSPEKRLRRESLCPIAPGIYLCIFYYGSGTAWSYSHVFFVNFVFQLRLY